MCIAEIQEHKKVSRVPIKPTFAFNLVGISRLRRQAKSKSDPNKRCIRQKKKQRIEQNMKQSKEHMVSVKRIEYLLVISLVMPLRSYIVSNKRSWVIILIFFIVPIVYLLEFKYLFMNRTLQLICNHEIIMPTFIGFINIFEPLLCQRFSELNGKVIYIILVRK